MNDTHHNSDLEEIEYVGAPTEYANAQEVPGWVATIVKVIFALPTALAALTIIELALLVIVLACLALFVVSLFAW